MGELVYRLTWTVLCRCLSADSLFAGFKESNMTIEKIQPVVLFKRNVGIG
jgi:hypothetical protein